jgi:hypothetical protein
LQNHLLLLLLLGHLLLLLLLELLLLLWLQQQLLYLQQRLPNPLLRWHMLHVRTRHQAHDMMLHPSLLPPRPT